MDAKVEAALDAMKRDLSRAWTVESLARAVGTSRAALQRRFDAELGTPPMKVLAQLRLEHAARRLAETDASLAALAAEVGYANEFALSKAFKRHHGVAPGAYRRAFMQPTRAAQFRCAA